MAAPSYPLAMPNSGLRTTQFKLITQDAVTGVRNGAAPATEIAPAYWDMSFEVNITKRRSQRYRDWMFFLKSLRGAKKIGLFFDSDLPCPANYDLLAMLALTRFGGGAFDGTGDVTSVTNVRTVVIEDLPAGFVFLKDDYVEFVKGGRHVLVSLNSDSTANGSGVATLYFEPAIPTYFDGTAMTYNVARAKCEGFLDGDYDAQRTVEGNSPISFSARSRGF